MVKYKYILALLIMTNSFVSIQAQNKSNMDSTFVMTLTKTIKAPIEKVWEAWSDSNFVKRWWGPDGFTAPVARIDFREGGISLVCMRSPQGFDIYNTWTYAKIVPMERIEFVNHFTDKDSNKLSPAKLGMPPGIPDEVPHVITFRNTGNGITEIMVKEYGYTNGQIVEISKMGMSQVLDKMAAVIEQK
jgi:uncharacterized protein YndB with AHSA1/START domain